VVLNKVIAVATHWGASRKIGQGRVVKQGFVLVTKQTLWKEAPDFGAGDLNRLFLYLLFSNT